MACLLYTSRICCFSCFLKFASDIKIEKAGKAADAKRIFGVMGLAAKQGEEVVIRVEGADEAEAAAAMETFFKENL